MLNIASWIINKVVPDYNNMKINEFKKRLPDIYKHLENYKKNKLNCASITNQLKERLSSWELFDNIINEAFANVIYASELLKWHKYLVKGMETEWNMIPYDVQIIWWINLVFWNISEMKTWEGKTLVAVFPSYARALVWKGVHVVTVNDYLASRDMELLQPLYNYLWLSVWCVTKDTIDRKWEYNKDITYVENSELWFDYLKDNLVPSLDERCINNYYFALVDEVDSIFIDEARTPLIISENSDDNNESYVKYAELVKDLISAPVWKQVSKWFVHNLVNDIEIQKEDSSWDYYVDIKTKTVALTENGMKKIEKKLKINNMYIDLWYEEIHYIENALKAKECYKDWVEYINKDWQIFLIDESTWRLQDWRRYWEWLHQAIEAKEWVEILSESKTIAKITYQNFFKWYEVLAWMSWTAITEWEEFDKIYKLDTFVIPTNKPVIRVDKNDKVFFSINAKYNNLLNDIKYYNIIWLPLLLWTSSIESSEQLSKLLQKHNIIHSVLNAKYHEQEANIISNWWKFKSVIVATNMAWRGTDIKLDKNLYTQLLSSYFEYIKNKKIKYNIFSQLEYDKFIDFYYENNLENDIKLDISLWNNNTFVIECNNNLDWDFIEHDFHLWLWVIWTEKHESRRIDNQLRWRAWRQWDPWFSQFYTSLDDSLMKKMWWQDMKKIALSFFSQDKLNSMELTWKTFSNSLEKAQKQIEWIHFWTRKSLYEYDSVIDKHRKKIYELRNFILENNNIYEYLKDNFIDKGLENIQKKYIDSVDYLDSVFAWIEIKSLDDVKNIKQNILKKWDDQVIQDVYKRTLLSIIDQLWIEHMDNIEFLQKKLAFLWYAEQDPLVEFKKESYNKFITLIDNFYIDWLIHVNNLTFEFVLEQTINNLIDKGKFKFLDNLNS